MLDVGAPRPSRMVVLPGADTWTLVAFDDEKAWFTTVGTDGRVLGEIVTATPFGRYPGPDGLIGAAPGENLQLLIGRGPFDQTARLSLGLVGFAVRNGDATKERDTGIGEATQRAGATAHGAGLGLVVWMETDPSGWQIRATRVHDGIPLDGEGVVLGSGFPASIAAIFDANDFVVVWADDEGIALRRIAATGALPDPAPSRISDEEASWVRLSSRGDGAALITWVSANTHAVRAARLTGSQVTGVTDVAPGVRAIRTGAAASLDAHLVAFFAPFVVDCRITCPQMPMPALARLVDAMGNPTGPVRQITGPIAYLTRDPAWSSGFWTVPVDQENGTFMARLDAQATAVGGTFVPPGSWIARSGERLELWSPHYRGEVSAEGTNVWYEPLPPIAAGERRILESAPVGGASLIQRDSRLLLRTIVPHHRLADLAVVHVGRIRQGADLLDTIRIEHRGGDVFPALRISLQSGFESDPEIVSTSRPLYELTEGPFVPGEVIEMTVRWSSITTSDLVVWALPEAREVSAEDNFLVLERVEPRRRAVRR